MAIKGAELHYFFLRGLGEVPRLLLELTQTPYDSVMYFSRKDPKDKEYKAIAPFGQMPLYTDDELGGTWLAQQGAIVRHIARRLGLGGKTSKDEALIDMLFEGAKDIQGKGKPTFLPGCLIKLEQWLLLTRVLIQARKTSSTRVPRRRAQMR